MATSRLTVGVLGLAALVAACSDAPSDTTPAGALTLFLEAMDRGAHDDTSLADAYRLLCGEAREALTHRAREATALGGGRDFEPWEMLAQGRFRPHFTPHTMRERVQGDTATVIVTGVQAGERAEVPLRREDGHWCVVLAL